MTVGIPGVQVCTPESRGEVQVALRRLESAATCTNRLMSGYCATRETLVGSNLDESKPAAYRQAAMARRARSLMYDVLTGSAVHKVRK